MAFTTSKSLLAKVRSGDEISWQEFYNTYKPLIYLCGGDCNLTIDEKEELVQKVMTEIFQKVYENSFWSFGIFKCSFWVIIIFSTIIVPMVLWVHR